MNLKESIRRILREEISDLKDIVFDMINDAVKDADFYVRNGSIWLIFNHEGNETGWAIELTKKGKLWYDYGFFQDIFKYFSLDVIENQHYIAEWVEDTIKNEVKYTAPKASFYVETSEVQDIIKNGIKHIEGV